MRKDALFILIVLCVGLASVYYSNQNTNDTLQNIRTNRAATKEKNTTKNNSSSNLKSVREVQQPSLSIKSSAPKTTISMDVSDYDVATNLNTVNSLPSARNTKVQKSLTRKQSSSNESEKQKEEKVDFDWNKEFASWTLVLLDNVTGLSGMYDLNSGGRCNVTFFLQNNEPRSISLKSVSRVRKNGNAVLFELPISLKIKYLKNSSAVYEASTKLVKLCKG